MLLEFSCSNHKSIKDKVLFSLLAGSDDTNEEQLKKYDNYRILRSAIIYGANGSGKSNFLNAIGYMKELVCGSIHFQPGQQIKQFIHKLSPADVPSTYYIQFVKNEVRYAYGFSIAEQKISEEYLYFFPNGRQVKIFERNGMEVSPGDKFKSAFDISLNILKPNRLLLSCAANYGNRHEIEEAFMFFMKDLVIYNSEINQWMEYSIRLMQDDPGMKEKFLNVMRMLGTGVKDVKMKLDKVQLEDIKNEIYLPEPFQSFIGSQEMSRFEAKMVYDHFETDLMSEESAGIKRLFQMICPIIDILQNGKILICDELDSSLHEAIIFQIVQLFHTYESEQFAQLIFTAHDTSLLDKDLFRRDQIWFTQLDKQRSTDLYSLSEIRNVRKTENLMKGYISGKYGAIPMLNQILKDEIEKEL